MEKKKQKLVGLKERTIESTERIVLSKGANIPSSTPPDEKVASLYRRRTAIWENYKKAKKNQEKLGEIIKSNSGKKRRLFMQNDFNQVMQTAREILPKSIIDSFSYFRESSMELDKIDKENSGLGKEIEAHEAEIKDLESKVRTFYIAIAVVVVLLIIFIISTL